MSDEEDYPSHRDEIRRRRIIDRAVRAADRIILNGSSGSVEETDYLTGAVALEFVNKVEGRLSAQLLRLELENRKR